MPILKSRDTPVAVLAWAVSKRAEPELREATFCRTTSLPDEVIEAARPYAAAAALAELVVINQTRLLRSTSLLVAIESNAGPQQRPGNAAFASCARRSRSASSPRQTPAAVAELRRTRAPDVEEIRRPRS